MTKPNHEAMITSKLNELVGYSPIRVTTEVPNIEGAEYREPWVLQGEPKPNLITELGGSALSLKFNGDAIQVVAQVNAETKPTTLNPADILRVQADHPLGYNMPLNGKRQPSAWPVSPNYPGTPTFAWGPHFIEYDWHDYIVTGVHPEWPSISTFYAYNAQRRDWQRGAAATDMPTLEEAIAGVGDTPMMHYISKVAEYQGWDDHSEQPDYVVTSCSQIIKDQGNGVKVSRPRHPENERPTPLDIDMYDLPKGSAEQDLLRVHLKRVRGLSRGSRAEHAGPMSQFEADSVYLYMSHD